MVRLWKAVCLALAVVALAMFAISCSSGGASYRVINAIANYNYQATGGFDITMNGSLVFSSVQFTNINPSGKDAYQKVSPGSDTLEVFAHGDSVNGEPVINSSLSFSGHTQYTVLLMGNNTTNPYVAQPFSDDNTVPASGDFEFRVIHASNNMPSGQPSGGVDIYIVGSPSVVTGPNPPPANANLNFGQASSYISEPTGTWYLVVTNHNFHTPIINPTAYAPGALQIHTIVLVDGPNGFGYGTPLIYNDLN
jgi:Domain of unknown function (DUF4397)